MKKSGIFSDSDSIKTFDLKRLVYFVIFILAFLSTEIGRNIYRPYIYSNNINDFGFADSIGNSGGILVQIFFGLTVFNSSYKKGLNLIAFFVVGYIIYEFLQPILPKGVFDWKDVFGTFIGGTLGMIIFIFINKWTNVNPVFFKFSKDK